jgi:hypothetical protein
MSTPDSDGLCCGNTALWASEEMLALIKKLGFHRTLVDNNCYKYPVYLKIARVPAKRLVFGVHFDCFSLFDWRSV